jgi:hypothetical protein
LGKLGVQEQQSERHITSAVLSQKWQQISKSRAASSRRGRSFELRKKAPNILKMLKRAQKCARLVPTSRQAAHRAKLATGKAMRIHVIHPERFG